MDELTLFRKNALLANLCKEWNSMWYACHDDKIKLMRLVLMRQSAPYFATFCYNGKGLSKKYCLNEFGYYVKGQPFENVDGVEGFTSAMWINAHDTIEIGVDTAQMLWCDNPTVVVPTSKCPTFYISNRSNVKFSLEGCNLITIYLFDESKVEIDDADETCSVIVYKYSKKAKATKGKFCFCNVKQFKKEVRL